jgi:hypothetical protein
VGPTFALQVCAVVEDTWVLFWERWDVFATGTLPVWSSKKPVSQETNLKLDRCRRSDVSEPGIIISLEPRNGSGVVLVFAVTASHPRCRSWDPSVNSGGKTGLEFSNRSWKVQYYVCIIKCFYFLSFLFCHQFPRS